MLIVNRSNVVKSDERTLANIVLSIVGVFTICSIHHGIVELGTD